MRQKPVDFNRLKRVLVAKLRHHGDVLLSSPLFSILKTSYPHLEIDAYLYKETLPLLEGHFAISQFLLYDRKWKKLPLVSRLFYEVKLLKTIRKRKYDLVINLTEGDRGALACRFSKALYSIGFDPEKKGMFGKKKCYTHIIKHTPKPRHTVEKHLDALRCLGIYPKVEERSLFFHIPEESKKKIESLLLEKGVSPYRFVQVHPVSRWMFKTLPIETVVQVIRCLQKRKEVVVLTASSDPEEMEMNRKIRALAPGTIDLSGQMSLKEFGALIAMSKLLISIDSLPIHLASALKKKTVAIFGPTCEVNWSPYQNKKARIVKGDFSCRPCYQSGCGGSFKSDCLERLSPDQILREAFSLLEISEKEEKLLFKVKANLT